MVSLPATTVPPAVAGWAAPPVEPGVLLRLDVGFVQKRATVCKFAGRATVEGKLVAEASFTAMIADPPA